MKTKGIFLEFHRVGWTYHTPAHKQGKINYGPSTTSGYRTFDWFHKLIDECPVLDRRPVTNVEFIISSPLFTFEDKAILCSKNTVFSTLDNEYGRLARRQDASTKTYGPLNRIPLKEFIEMWRQEGAKTGVVRNGEILWEIQ